ncbi:hypothetical protein GCM10022287_28140 [Gryllotalpicola koreensis]|uniref:FHA domain-containing protein n=1 Tax=Gryllotalpicola koreensis TaxID=993086 RepID=A0ABP8A5F5_9MICO
MRVHATASGGWLTVAIPGTLLLVESTPSRVPDADELLAALHSSDPVPAALDILTSGGFSAMPAFALVEYRGQSAHYFVRGGVEIAFTGSGGERTASGAGITTWTEQLISGVDAFSVAAAGAAGGEGLPLVDGAVWGERIEYRGTDASAELPFASTAGFETPASQAPQPAKTAVPAEETLLPESIDEETVITPLPVLTQQPETPIVPEDSIPLPEGTTGYDHLFGVTQMKSVEAAAVRPKGEEEDEAQASVAPAAAPATDVEDAGDHDGLTMMSGDIAELRKRAASAAQGGVPVGRRAADADPEFRIEFPDGRTELLDRPIIVGRSPSANKVSGSELPRLIKVGDSDPDISRNHVRFTVEGGTVVITDLHSRNGTLMSLPGRPPLKLREGEPTSALVGTVVDLGGGIRITVTGTTEKAAR